MFSSSQGTRSIKDFNYKKHSDGAMINIKKDGFKTVNLNSRLDDSFLENLDIDSNLASYLLMQDESREQHQMLNFDQETKSGARYGAESVSAVKNRQITPNPFYHAQKRKLMHIYQKQLL